MIPLIRTRTAAAINAKYRGADKKVKDKELLVACREFLNDPDKKITFTEVFWKAAKTQLKKESFGKCAYCEANTTVVAHGDTEHYRPKDIYWWLAYTYDNYLYACQICNQSYKSNHFPFNGKKFPGPQVDKDTPDATIDSLCGNISPDPIDVATDYKLSKYLQHHQDEVAYLLNPYFDIPTDFIAYAADDVKEEVDVVATKAVHQPVIEAMEDYYGINRIELKNLRYTTYDMFRTYIAAYRELADGPTKWLVLRQIDQMTADKALFAGMNRYFKTVL